MRESRYVETATQILHRLTSYEPGRDWDVPVDDPRVVQDLQANDLARLPWLFKRYVQRLPRLSLPRDLPPATAPAVAVLAGAADVPRTELDLAQLSRLLHLSAGVVRTMERPYGTHLFRAAGSAGGRFPLELYVAVPEGLPLPALAQVGPPPRGGAPAVIVTGVLWRTGRRYRERGYRHVYWDAGTMLAQLLALADSAGLTAALYTRFPDAAVAAPTGADQVHEMPVAVVGETAPALEATGPAIAGEVNAAPVEFPRDERSEPGSATGWGRRGIGAPRCTSRSSPRHRSTASSWCAGLSGAWTANAACRRASCALPWASLFVASACPTGSWCTMSRASHPAFTAGPTCRLQRAQARSGTSYTGSSNLTVLAGWPV
jgi:hypothetical protein